MNSMAYHTRLACLGVCIAALISTVSSVPASAYEFVIAGPRAGGMGGAGVASTTDALATYWNPAGLVMADSTDTQAQAAIQAVDRLGIRNTLDEINNIDLTNITPGNALQLQGLLNRLNTSSLSGTGAGGLYFKGDWGTYAVGFNVSDVATGGLFTPTPLTVAVSGPTLVVNGQLQADALEARQFGVSTAVSLVRGTFALGVTNKVIQGAAYSNGIAVFNGDSFKFTGDLGEANISTRFSVDVGAILRPAEWLRIGVVGKDLLEPTFNAPDGRTFRLVPQIRGGIAINPHETLTLAFDADITSNATLVPGQKSQVFSLGLEQTSPGEVLSLRAGAYKNVQDAKSKVTPTAGLGLRLFWLKFDFAGGYDFSEGGALASFSLTMTF